MTSPRLEPTIVLVVMVKTPISQAGSSTRPANVEAMRLERGFTLLELIVVMLIIGGAMALVVPLYQSKSITPEHQAALLVDQIHAKRQKAIRTGEMIEMKLAELKAGMASDFDIKSVSLDGNEADRLVFYPMGNSNGGRFLLEGGDRALHIEIDWMTGQARSRQQ